MSRNRLTYQLCPPTLPQLASTAVAVHLWHHEVLNRWSTNTIRQISELFLSFSLDNIIPVVPTSIRTLITDLIDPVRRELESWMQYHHDRIFTLSPNSTDSIERLIEFLDQVVWLPAGDIDYEATAKKMMNWDRLTKFEQYSIACTYCFEEDILRLRRHQKETLRRESITYMSYSLVYYWEYRLVDGIPIIPTDIPNFLDTNVVDWPAVDNWPAIRYFWPHLDGIERVHQTVLIIARYHDAKFTPQVLVELTEDQFEQVVRTIGSVMMLRMINNPKLADYTYQTWLRVRCMITRVQFFEIIRGVLNTKIRYGGAITDTEVSLRVKIWSSADDGMKRTALANLINESTPFEYQGSLKHLSRDMEFLLAILSDASSQQRGFVWRNHWSNLIRGTGPYFLDQLMTMCLRDPEEVAQFKRQILMEFGNIRKYCMELAEERLFAELNEFLRFCCLDEPDRIVDLKRQVLLSCFLAENSKINYHLLRDIRLLDEFVEEVFQNHDSAKTYKERMVLLPNNFEFYRMVIQNGDLYLVKNLFNLFLSSEPDLKWIKYQFLDECRSSLFSDNFWKFEVQEWRDFIEWCSGSEQKRKEFKRSIRLNEVFETILTRCLEFQSHTHCCDIYAKCDNDLRLYALLDNLLMWYFGSWEETERYKLSRIERYEEIDALKKVLCEGSECIIEDTLKWFFNGDDEKVKEFRMSFRN